MGVEQDLLGLDALREFETRRLIGRDGDADEADERARVIAQRDAVAASEKASLLVAALELGGRLRADAELLDGLMLGLKAVKDLLELRVVPFPNRRAVHCCMPRAASEVLLDRERGG